MRLLAATLLATFLATGAAYASSFEVIPAAGAGDTPSIEAVGGTSAATPDIVSLPAMKTAPTVANEVGDLRGMLAEGATGEAGDDAATPGLVQLSPSIIAMADSLPGVSPDIVASIDGDAPPPAAGDGATKAASQASEDESRSSRNDFHAMPMVIRGGIVGDAFEAPPSSPADTTAEAASQQPKTAAGAGQGASAAGGQPAQQPQEEPPAPPEGLRPAPKMQ